MTVLSICAGLTSIKLALEHQPKAAMALIAAAAILDGLDGRVARILDAQSRMGEEIDSLADAVNFGVTPAIVLYVTMLSKSPAGWVAILLYAVCVVLRLARYNALQDDGTQPAYAHEFFVGMPAPAGAVVGLLPVYVRVLSAAPNEPVSRAFVGVEAIYVIAVAILMASRVPHFSGKSIGRIPREYVAVALIGVVAALLSIAYFPLEALVALAAFYLGSIPFAIRRFWRLEAEHRREIAEASG
jgi:CDP-diacylglycerol---serine O-phosphatidyltransferase